MTGMAPRLRQSTAAEEARGHSPGLFTRLGRPGAAAGHGRWACECCVPEYERALRRQP